MSRKGRGVILVPCIGTTPTMPRRNVGKQVKPLMIVMCLINEKQMYYKFRVWHDACASHFVISDFYNSYVLPLYYVLSNIVRHWDKMTVERRIGLGNTGGVFFEPP